MCHLYYLCWRWIEEHIRKLAQTDAPFFPFCFVFSCFHLRRRTHHVGSVTRTSFKYKLMGLWINVSKIIFLSFILCLFIHNSRWKHSRKTTVSNLHKHHFSEMSANNCFQLILTVGSISLGNCHFSCPRSFNSNYRQPEIRQGAENCNVCQLHKPRNQKETLKQQKKEKQRGARAVSMCLRSRVKVIYKMVMLKALMDGTDQYEALLELRNTPRQDTDISPAEVTFGRNARAMLPSAKTKRRRSSRQVTSRRAKRRHETWSHSFLVNQCTTNTQKKRSVIGKEEPCGLNTVTDPT